MTKEKFVYTGGENLEAMQEAKNYNKFLIKFVEDNITKNRKKVLDFGAGTGTYAEMLKEGGLQVDCLEPDETQARLLKSMGYKVIEDANDLKAGSYDLIYAFNVLEHIEDDGSIVKTLTKALKPGGKLVIYVPAFQLLFTSMDKKVGHYRRYKKDRLQDHAEAASLIISRLEYCDPLGFFAALVFKYIGNKNGVVSSGSVRLYDRIIFPISRLLQPICKGFVGKNVVLVAEKK